MAHIIFKKRPRDIKYFARRSISMPLAALKVVLPSDKVIIEIYSNMLPKEDRSSMPEKIVVEMTGKEFLDGAKKMNDCYCIVNC